jgi:sarcosine oxidase subunit beta
MSEDPDVAIVGGGAVGTSVLYHLTQRGVTDVALFEKGQLGAGATSKAVGGVRNVFSHPMNVAVGTEMLAYYRQFAAETGADLELDEAGYLYLYDDDDRRDRWAERRTHLDEHGASTEFLDRGSVGDLFPPTATERIAGGLYAPDCLHLDPHTVTRGFATAAERDGAEVNTGTPVEAIDAADGRVEAVETADGTVHPEYVVNAAGPWAPKLAASVGIDVPVSLSARRIAVTEGIVDHSSPLLIDRSRGCYFRTERNGSLLLCDTDGDIEDVGDPAEVQRGDIGFDYYLDALSKVSELVPGIEDAAVVNGWAGVQTHTPDGHPILGPTGIDGLLLACGFNGLGVMFAPAIGAAIADVITGGSTTALDVDRLGLDRFARPSDRRITPENLA